MEARPPAENRHGGAPERRARPAGRAPRLARHGRSRVDTRDKRNSAPFRRSARPSIGVGWKEESKPGRRQRAAGMKKIALFEIVNRKWRGQSRRRQRTRPRPRARFAASFCDGHARRARAVDTTRTRACPAASP